jgi:hypothetical protein
VFEQSDLSFIEHVKSEHNMWQYVWFTIYMESKDPLTYTGPEQYVYENLVDKNVSPLPFSPSLFLPDLCSSGIRETGADQEESLH